MVTSRRCRHCASSAQFDAKCADYGARGRAASRGPTRWHQELYLAAQRRVRGARDRRRLQDERGADDRHALTGRGTLRAANSCLIARLATIAAFRRNTVLPLDHCLYALQMTILAAPRPRPLAGKRWRQTETKRL